MEEFMLYKNEKNNTEQVQMVSLEQLVPKDHILRKINKYIDFKFIYDLVEDKYSQTTGRPSIDPVVLIKLVILQYFFNINSMRQTIREVEVNIAYRWFLGLDFYDKVPHFSTFGKNYERRFKNTEIFNQIFENILDQAINYGFVDTKMQFVDSTHVKAHANRHKNQKVKIKKKVKSYQRKLEKEVNEERNNNGKDDFYYPDGEILEEKEIIQSTTDPESGLFHKGNHKEVFAYSIQTSCDKNGWILGYKSYPANLHDSTTFPSFFKEKLEKYKPEKIVMDAGYKIPAIAKELIEKGIMPVLPYTRPKGKTDKESFYPKQYKYDETNDCYICPENKILLYSTTNREGYRIYQSKKSLCENCPSLSKCTKSKSKVKVIIRHIWQEYIDYCECYRLTKAGKTEYNQRKETIERQFASAKEYHSFRYINMIGKAKMSMKAALTFACLNMKKLAKLLDKLDKNGGDFPKFTKIFTLLYENLTNLLIKTEKASINPIYWWVCRRSESPN